VINIGADIGAIGAGAELIIHIPASVLQHRGRRCAGARASGQDVSALR